jgi:hypothetical protein
MPNTKSPPNRPPGQERDDGQVAHATPQYAKPPNRKEIQSRDPRNRRNIYPSVGDDKHPPLLAGGGYIRRGSCSLSTLAAAAVSSSGGVAMSFWEGSSLLVDLSGSGPNTNEDTGELSRRNSTMNPAFALAAMDQESANDDEEIFQDVAMKLAIAHHLKRNVNLMDLSFTPIQLTNMIQVLIDNRCEIIQFAVLCDSNRPSCTDPITPHLEQALPNKLSKRKAAKEYMADSLAEIYFGGKDIACCHNVASTLPQDRTKHGSALSEFTMALVHYILSARQSWRRRGIQEKL